MKVNVVSSMTDVYDGLIGDRRHQVFNDGKQILDMISRTYAIDGGVKVRVFNPSRLFLTDEYPADITNDELIDAIELEILKRIIGVNTYGKSDEDAEALKTARFVGMLPKSFTLSHMVTLNTANYTVLYPLETTFNPQPDLTINTRTAFVENYDYGSIPRRHKMKTFPVVEGVVTADMNPLDLVAYFRNLIMEKIA